MLQRQGQRTERQGQQPRFRRTASQRQGQRTESHRNILPYVEATGDEDADVGSRRLSLNESTP